MVFNGLGIISVSSLLSCARIGAGAGLRSLRIFLFLSCCYYETGGKYETQNNAKNRGERRKAMAAGIGVGQGKAKGIIVRELYIYSFYIVCTRDDMICTTKQTKNDLLPQLPQGKNKPHERKRVVVGHVVQELKYGSQEEGTLEYPVTPYFTFLLIAT